MKISIINQIGRESGENYKLKAEARQSSDFKKSEPATTNHCSLFLSCITLSKLNITKKLN